MNEKLEKKSAHNCIKIENLKYMNYRKKKFLNLLYKISIDIETRPQFSVF